MRRLKSSKTHLGFRFVPHFSNLHGPYLHRNYYRNLNYFS